MSKKETKQHKILFPLIAVLIMVAEYLWRLLYYNELFSKDELLSVSKVTFGNLGEILIQHSAVILPVALIVVVALAILRRKFCNITGLSLGNRRGKIALLICTVLYVVLLVLTIYRGKTHVLALVYQWFYYLFIMSFAEEIVFDGIMPPLIEKSGLPGWCVWIIPGLLFGVLHVLIELIGATVTPTLILTLALSVGVNLLIHCAFYWLHHWSEGIWLPVMVHAVLNFARLLV